MAADDQRLTRTVAIVNKRGLHARAAAKFVKLVDQFDAKISVSREDITVGGDSLMGLMTLEALIGTSIEIAAEGKEAVDALDALCALVSNGFGEG